MTNTAAHGQSARPLSGILQHPITSPVSAADIAARFRKGKAVEKEIALTLRAFVRFGDLATTDGGKTFQLRQVV